MVWQAKQVEITKNQEKVLQEISSSRSSRSDCIKRSKLILMAGSGKSNTLIAKELNLSRRQVGIWRKRWLEHAEALMLLERNESGVTYKRGIIKILSDKPRPGAPGKFSAEEICQMISVACERPEDSGLPISHWSLTSLKDEIIKRKIVETVSTSQLHVFLKSGRIKTS